MNWPDGFMWGTGASSTQCEGAAPASDWIDWEQAGKAPVSGDGNGFATRYAEDFRNYAEIGLRHHRLSIEWARIEPEEGRRDNEAVAHYRRILEAARDIGIEPWVCLHHFTLPRWYAARGSFPGDTTEAWMRHVDFIAETYGDLVAGWKPINEPIGYAGIGWFSGGFPPGRSDVNEFRAALEATHVAAFDAALRLRQTGAPVATIHNLSTFHPVGDGDAKGAVAAFESSGWRVWVEATRDGVLRVSGRDPIDRPEFVEAFDLIGFSYYSATGVRADRTTTRHPADAPRSPLGYGIWAEGLRLVLDKLHHELPGRPLLISEFGIGTQDDTERARYLKRGIEIAREAIADGIDLRGFFHWTGVDNYEWLHGYDVSFGLWDRDRNRRGSAEVLRAAIGG